MSDSSTGTSSSDNNGVEGEDFIARPIGHNAYNLPIKERRLAALV